MEPTRLTYEESCRKIGLPAAAPLPDHLPQDDDAEPLGVSFFRCLEENRNFSNLSLPRTFFGRSELRVIAFHSTDLSESNLCWNNFTDVDFSNAILAGSDMRASIFKRCSFVGADLRRCDLRRSSFVGCIFDQAIMEGAIVTRFQRLPLSGVQRSAIDWRWRAGKQPQGG